MMVTLKSNFYILLLTINTVFSYDEEHFIASIQSDKIVHFPQNHILQPRVNFMNCLQCCKGTSENANVTRSFYNNFLYYFIKCHKKFRKDHYRAGFRTDSLFRGASYQKLYGENLKLSSITNNCLLRCEANNYATDSNKIAILLKLFLKGNASCFKLELVKCKSDCKKFENSRSKFLKLAFLKVPNNFTTVKKINNFFNYFYVCCSVKYIGFKSCLVKCLYAVYGLPENICDHLKIIESDLNTTTDEFPRSRIQKKSIKTGKKENYVNIKEHIYGSALHPKEFEINGHVNGNMLKHLRKRKHHFNHQLLQHIVFNTPFTTVHAVKKREIKNPEQGNNYTILHPTEMDFIQEDDHENYTFHTTDSFPVSFENIDPLERRGEEGVIYIHGLFEMSGGECRVYPETGRLEFQAAQLAIQHVNEKNIIDGYRVEMYYNDTKVRGISL